MYVFIFANFGLLPNPAAQTKAPISGRKQMAVVCVPPCPSVSACDARTLALESEWCAGVASRTLRLFEIIRQLPSLPGVPEFTLLLFLIVSCPPLSGLAGFFGATVADSWERLVL